MKTKSLLFLLLALSATTAFAHSEHQAPTMPKEFDMLKKLEGTWEGTSDMGKDGKPSDAVTVYKVTSGGTALTETLMPGTDHEMISVYHKDGKTLGMTHYCAMGNQPHMMLKGTTGNTISFEMKKPVGISSPKEMHMHAITITMKDDNTLQEAWTSFDGGKKAMTATFTMHRKK